jgi:hypothetical protein
MSTYLNVNQWVLTIEGPVLHSIIPAPDNTIKNIPPDFKKNIIMIKNQRS